MIALFAEILSGLLAAPLIVAGLAKGMTPAERLFWPFTTGPLRAPHGPRLVGVAEILAALALVLLPGPTGVAPALLAYGALAVVSYRLRGQKCACFGVAKLAAIGAGHISLNLAATIVAIGLFSIRTLESISPLWSTRLGVTIGGTIALATAILFIDRRNVPVTDSDSDCGRSARGVLLYTSVGCPACRSLERLLSTVETARREAITIIVVDQATVRPPALANLGFPCATGVDAAGTPVCAPVSGIGPVKALIDSLTIGHPVTTSGSGRDR